MTVTPMTVLLAIESWFQLDILAWIIGIPVLMALIVVLYHQYRHSRQLKGELDQLASVKTLSVENELVLKTMRLCVWRVNVKTRVVSFDSDYRDYSDLLYFPPDTKVEDVFSHVLPEYRPVPYSVSDGVVAQHQAILERELCDRRDTRPERASGDPCRYQHAHRPAEGD